MSSQVKVSLEGTQASGWLGTGTYDASARYQEFLTLL